MLSRAIDAAVTALAWLGDPLHRLGGGRVLTGDYGRAVWGAAVVLFIGGIALAAWSEPIGLGVLVVVAAVAASFVLLRHGPGAWRRPGPWGRALLLAAAPLLAALVVWLRWDARVDAAGAAWAVVTALVVAAVVPLGVWGFGEVFGPFHDESSREPIADDAVRWVWSGGVTDGRATVVCRLQHGLDPADARLTLSGGAEGSTAHVDADPGDRGLVRFRCRDLDPGREYDYRVEAGGRSGGEGRLRTLPTGRPASFRVVAGSCASTASRGRVFERMADADAHLVVHLGDLHYENIGARGADDRIHAAYDSVLGSPPQAHLYRRTPIARIWDDHDYGRNNSDSSSPARDEAQQAFRDVVPFDTLVEPETGPIHHALQLGRVRFVLTDTRSERSDEEMIGAEQQRWLVGQVLDADPATTRLVVWCAAIPWIADDPDTWAGYPRQRETIARALADREVGLLYLAGDAHMMALDTGDHGDGFPVVNAAALDRRKSTKGGSYEYGPVPGAGQFAVIDIDDPGDAADTMVVRVRVRRWDDSHGGSMSLSIGPDGRTTVVDRPATVA